MLNCILLQATDSVYYLYNFRNNSEYSNFVSSLFEQITFCLVVGHWDGTLQHQAEERHPVPAGAPHPVCHVGPPGGGAVPQGKPSPGQEDDRRICQQPFQPRRARGFCKVSLHSHFTDVFLVALLNFGTF